MKKLKIPEATKQGYSIAMGGWNLPKPPMAKKRSGPKTNDTDIDDKQ